MLKSIFFHAITERPPIGEELDSEMIVQVNPEKGKPYCTSGYYTLKKGFWNERGPIENVVAWALMPEPSNQF